MLNQFKINKNLKVRLLVIGGIVALSIVGLVALILHHRSVSYDVSSSSVSSASSISSIPGAGDPNSEYVASQNKDNEKQAVEAYKNVTSNVPTITRSGFLGDPSEFASNGGGDDALSVSPANCGVKKINPNATPDPKNCTASSLQLARQAGVKAEELVCSGCECPALKMAGYTVGDLKEIGFTAKQLKDCGFSLGELVAAGFSAADLKEAGYSAKDLADVGFSAAQLAKAGFSAKDLKDAGFSAEDLAKAGLSAQDLKDAGFSDDDINKSGALSSSDGAASLANTAANPDDCSVQALKKQRDRGVSAKTLKDKGCGLAALKAAGYTASELKAAGYSAADLKKAGFTADQLAQAGFTAGQLAKAEFSASQLKNAGFSAADLKNAGVSAKDLKSAGFSAGDLSDAGFSAGDLKAAGYDATDLKNAGFSASDLRDIGFSASDLKQAGFNEGDIKEAGFSSGDLLRAGFSTEQPVATVEQQVKPAPTPVSNASVDTKQVPDVDSNSPEDRMKAILAAQEKQLNAQQRQNQINQTQSAMMGQAQQMLSQWGDHSAQALSTAPADVVTSGGANATADQGAAAKAPTTTYKAGEIMFAVLVTSMNSDEKTPILANIVDGPLKGGKLIGSFTRVDKKLLITFNTLNLPSLEKSISISAVAIDPDTARTALSGDVNNHTLLRYGTLFGASFLEGIGNSFQSTSTALTSVDNTVFIQSDPPNPTSSALQGLGKVGQNAGKELEPIFNKDPTIKISSGTGIGLLITKDLKIPLTSN